jgi:hypothetical protein
MRILSTSSILAVGRVGQHRKTLFVPPTIAHRGTTTSSNQQELLEKPGKIQ